MSCLSYNSVREGGKGLLSSTRDEMSEKHLVLLKKVPIAYDKSEDRFVCQKCNKIFRDKPTTKDCEPIKYNTSVNYRDAEGINGRNT